jgi:hypothetical protein
MTYLVHIILRNLMSFSCGLLRTKSVCYLTIVFYKLMYGTVESYALHCTYCVVSCGPFFIETAGVSLPNFLSFLPDVLM